MSPAEKAESMARLRALNGMEAPRSQDPAELGRQAAMTRYDQLAAGHQPEKPVTYDQHSDAAGQFQQNLAAADARLAPVRQAAGEASDARFAAAAQLSPEAQRRVFSNAPKYVPR